MLRRALPPVIAVAVALVAAFASVGCVTEADTVGEIRGPLGGTTDESVPLDGAIVATAGGQWGRTAHCPSPAPSTCQIERNFWVDLAIRNDAYDKRVGIVWTDTVRDAADAPWHTAYARYEHALEAPYEQWGVDVTAGVYGAIEPNPHIRFAAFVEMNGQTYWDNNGGADHALP
ncbi:MAG: hypothetical protein AB7T06_08470 [Kofleriaceae bacterium]